YTEANAKFARAVDRNNPILEARADAAADLRRKGKPTLPALLGEEKQANPFLRADEPAFHKALAKSGFAVHDADPAAILGSLRAAKDRFNTQQATGGN